MRLIDRYIFSEWLKTFIMALGATLSILLIEDMQDDLEDFFNWEAHPLQILEYYLNLIPTFLPVILPVSFLVSLLFMLGNLHRNNEIIALRAGGLHLFKITRSLWLAGGLLSLAMLYLNTTLIPQSIQHTRFIRDKLRFAQEEKLKQDINEVGLIYTLPFDNQKENRLWLMNRFGQRSNLGFGVNVYLHDEAGHELSRISAQNAYFDENEEHWVFQNGSHRFFNAEGEAYRNQLFEEKIMEEFTETPETMLNLAKDPDDLSLFELQDLLDKISPEENPQMHAYAVRYHSNIATPFSCLIIVGIAIPFAVGGVRTNPMVGVCKAVGLFIVYFVFTSITRVTGEQNLITPTLAAWLPIGLMFAFSLLLFRKAK